MAVSYRQNGGVESSGAVGGAAGSTQVAISGYVDSSGATVNVADSANNALKVNVVAGAAAGSTAVTISRIQDSSNTGLAVGDSANNAIRVNVVAGAAAGSTDVRATIGTNLQSTAVTASNSSALNVRVIGGVSSAVDFQARVNQGVGNSSAADRWLVNTANSSAADYHGVRLVDSSGTGYHSPSNPLPVALAIQSSAAANSNSSALLVRVVGGVSSAVDFPARVNQGVGISTVADYWGMRAYQSTAADLNVTVAGYVAPSTDVRVTIGTNLQSTSLANSNSSALNVRVVGGVSSASDFSVRVVQSTATDLVARVNQGVGISTVTDYWGVRAYQSTATDLLGRMNQGVGNSSAADRWNVAAMPASTVWASSAGFHFDGAGNLFVMNPEFDSTYASGSKNSSGDTTLISSGGSTRINVHAITFTVDSTTPTLVRLMNGSTVEMARWQFRAPSSIAVGANLAVSMPAYLYRTAVNNALILHTDSTATVHYSIAAFRST